jgi:sugar phosphate isomerase/epimerase
MYITGADPATEVARFAGRINYVQIRDLDDRWPAAREVFPGTGNLDFRAILRALIDAGYSGFLHPEHLGQPRFEGDDLEKDATRLVRNGLPKQKQINNDQLSRPKPIRANLFRRTS